MDLGQRLVKIRESKNISVEEAVKGLKTTKQTLTKWEKGTSTPNLKKLITISDFYQVSLDELVLGKEIKEEKVDTSNKKFKGICSGIVLYMIAIIWLFISILVLGIDSIISISIFLLIISLASFYIVYHILTYKNITNNDYKDIINNIENIGSIITLFIYILISFMTMAWHITWIIWILFELIIIIVKLVKYLKDKKYEK